MANLNDVITIRNYPDGKMFTQHEDVVEKNICISREKAIEILGENVSLESIRVLCHDPSPSARWGYETFIKVYVSKHGTCCLLAEEYQKPE